MYSNAWVPEQQVAPVVDYFMNEHGAETFFLIGSDYAFGRGMLDFSRKYIEEQGGTGSGRGISADGCLGLDGDHLQPQVG